MRTDLEYNQIKITLSTSKKGFHRCIGVNNQFNFETPTNKNAEFCIDYYAKIHLGNKTSQIEYFWYTISSPAYDHILECNSKIIATLASSAT